MSLGKILVASGVLQEKDVNKALARQKQEGGLFGANLIALGLITPEQLETALHGFPTAPKGTEDTGVSINILLRLMLKVIYVGAYETPAEIADEMMLPYPIVATLLEEADDRRLVEILGALDKSVHSQFRYALTAKGREWAIEALEQSQYAGPAPVSLDSYIEQIERQKITNERINKEKINSGFEGLPQNRFVAGFIGNPPISFADGKIEDGRFVTPGLRFELPDRIKGASVSAGQNITVGVRPEYLHPDFATPIEGEITFIESQGREILYDLTLAGGQVFRSIQSGEQVCQLGDRIHWGIDAEAVFFFDEQGNRM